jgi:hypothetical protein
VRKLAFCIVLLVGWGIAAPAAPAGQDDEFEGLPAGPGREATFYACSACHSIKLVKQQRLTRADWDEALVYMTEEMEMPEPEPAERTRILDYLGRYLGRQVPR